MGVSGFALLSRCFIQDDVFDKSGILLALFTPNHGGEGWPYIIDSTTLFLI